MSKTGEHLAAAIAELAKIEGSDERAASVDINIHWCPDAVEVVSALPGGRCDPTTRHDRDGTVVRYDVAKATVGRVDVTAFGGHVKMKVVDA
jgi:Asp-tRNA(Asn)/Glu-tRNA(Gln) amidotransferase C subunit